MLPQAPVRRNSPRYPAPPTRKPRSHCVCRFKPKPNSALQWLTSGLAIVHVAVTPSSGLLEMLKLGFSISMVKPGFSVSWKETARERNNSAPEVSPTAWLKCQFFENLSQNRLIPKVGQNPVDVMGESCPRSDALTGPPQTQRETLQNFKCLIAKQIMFESPRRRDI